MTAFRALKIQLTRSKNWRLYLLGMFYNTILPGGIGGDGYKVFYLNKNHKLRTKKSLVLMIGDRLAGLYALVSIAIIVGIAWYQIPLYFIGLVLIPIGYGILYFLCKRLIPRIIHFYNKIIGLSFAVQILQVLCILILVIDLGYSSEWLGFTVLFLVSSIIAAIPITIGGLGSREIAGLYLAELLVLDVNVAISIGLIFYILTLLLSLFGMVYSFKGISESVYLNLLSWRRKST